MRIRQELEECEFDMEKWERQGSYRTTMGLRAYLELEEGKTVLIIEQPEEGMNDVVIKRSE